MATEKRLIDRNEIFPNGTFFANAEDPLRSLDELIKRIWSIPTVGAVPVVHGRWEQCFEDWRHQIEGDKCSACGYEHYGCGIKHYHYCPNCGAKMDGDGNA